MGQHLAILAAHSTAPQHDQKIDNSFPGHSCHTPPLRSNKQPVKMIRHGYCKTKEQPHNHQPNPAETIKTLRIRNGPLLGKALCHGFPPAPDHASETTVAQEIPRPPDPDAYHTGRHTPKGDTRIHGHGRPTQNQANQHQRPGQTRPRVRTHGRHLKERWSRKSGQACGGRFYFVWAGININFSL